MVNIKDLKNHFFSKNYEAVWREFSLKNKGNYIVGIADKLDSVEIIYLDHKIIFDRYIRYQVVGGQSFDTEFTRIRLEFKSPDELRFKLAKQGLIDSIAKLFGARDIKIGDREFDKRFMIKGNDEYKVQKIFSNNSVKNLILSQKDIQLQILDKEGIFYEPVPEGNVLLYYISETQISEVDQLNSLLKLYKEIIDQLTKLNSIKAIKASR